MSEYTIMLVQMLSLDGSFDIAWFSIGLRSQKCALVNWSLVKSSESPFHKTFKNVQCGSATIVCGLNREEIIVFALCFLMVLMP